MCLHTPNLNNLRAKLPIVSGLHLKYSRFLETATRDRARSALRGVGRSDHFSTEVLGITQGMEGALLSGAPMSRETSITRGKALRKLARGLSIDAAKSAYD